MSVGLPNLDTGVKEEPIKRSWLCQNLLESSVGDKRRLERRKRCSLQLDTPLMRMETISLLH